MAIQNELKLLPADQQDRISAFLTTLRLKRQGLMTEFSRRLDDAEADKWVPWDDVKPDLDAEPSE